LRARIVIVSLVGVGVIAWAAVGRTQSQVPGVPSPGEAPVRVVNEVATRATQSGAWQVSLAPAATVGLAPDSAVAPMVPDFLRLGRRYLISASNSPAAVFTIDRVDHGWVRAVGPGGVRWFNLAQIISLQEAQ
jgi:hypothetical protein